MLQVCPGFCRWPDQREPARRCSCSCTPHPLPGKPRLEPPLIPQQNTPLRPCFPEIVFSAGAPSFISASHWLLCVIFDTLLRIFFIYVISRSVKYSLFSRRWCFYPAVFLFSLKLRENLQLQGKLKSKSRNDIPAEMYLGGTIPPLWWPRQLNFRYCGNFYLLHPNTCC